MVNTTSRRQCPDCGTIVQGLGTRVCPACGALVSAPQAIEHPVVSTARRAYSSRTYAIRVGAILGVLVGYYRMTQGYPLAGILSGTVFSFIIYTLVSWPLIAGVRWLRRKVQRTRQLSASTSRPPETPPDRAIAEQWWEQFEEALLQSMRSLTAMTEIGSPDDPLSSDASQTYQAEIVRARQLFAETQSNIARAAACLPYLERAWPDKRKGLNRIREGLTDFSAWVRVMEEMHSMTHLTGPASDMRTAQKLVQMNRQYCVRVREHFKKGFALLGRSVDLE